MDAFLREYYQKNKCPRKHVLHQTAIAAPRAPKSASIGVVPAMILPHLQQADAPALTPHMLVGRGVAGAAPPGPPSAVHSKQGQRAATTPEPSTPEPMDGVDRTSRGVRRERQSGPRASLVSLFDDVAATPPTRPRRDAGPATPPTRPPDAAPTRPPEPQRGPTLTNVRPEAGPSVSRKRMKIPATNLQTKRGKNFDDDGTKMFRGQYGRSRSSTGAPGRSARLAGLP